jgi:hypothetical protein
MFDSGILVVVTDPGVEQVAENVELIGSDRPLAEKVEKQTNPLRMITGEVQV